MPVIAIAAIGFTSNAQNTWTQKAGIDDCYGDVDKFGVGISAISNAPSILSVFPNPAKGKFLIDLRLIDQETAAEKIEVLNLLGQVVYNKTSALVKGKLEEVIELSDAADGIYLVRVVVSDQVFTAQIIYRQ